VGNTQGVGMLTPILPSTLPATFKNLKLSVISAFAEMSDRASAVRDPSKKHYNFVAKLFIIDTSSIAFSMTIQITL
jgi:hypothetical protein